MILLATLHSKVHIIVAHDAQDSMMFSSSTGILLLISASKQHIEIFSWSQWPTGHVFAKSYPIQIIYRSKAFWKGYNLAFLTKNGQNGHWGGWTLGPGATF